MRRASHPPGENQMPRRKPLLRLLSTSALLLLTATASLPLEGPPPPTKSRTSTPPAFSPLEMGSRVFLDPETGRIISRPTAAQLEALGQGPRALRTRPSAWELRDFYLPGGGQGVFLDGWADHSLSVRRTPSGELYFVCTHGDEDITATPESGAPSR